MYKVCHTTTKFVNGGGADLNIFYSISRLSDKYKFDLIVGRDYSEELTNKLKDLGVTIHVVNELEREISLKDDIVAYKKMKKIISENKYDIVHSHNAKAGILSRLAASRCDVPVIIHGIHGMSFGGHLPFHKHILFKVIEKYVGKMTSCFVSVGENIVKEMLEAGIGSKEQHFVINSGMELDRFLNAKYDKELRKNYASENEVLISIIARLQRNKGHGYFIDAFSSLSKELTNIKAIFVGDGEDREEIQQLIDKNGLHEKIMIAGYKTDVEKYLAISDIVCLTSEREGIPQSLIQAAAVGKPMVAFDVNGVYEIVEDGFNGYLVPFQNIKFLEEQLKNLICNKALRDKMGNNSKQKVDDRWTIDTMASKTHELYSYLLEANLKKSF